MLTRTAMTVLVCVAFCSSVTAQSHVTGAMVTGSVYDETGSVLSGATITATHTTRNVSRSTISDARGRYSVPALSPGSYSVSAAMPGFAKQSREGFVLELGQNATLDFTLALAPVEEYLSVTADSPIVDADKTVVDAVVNQKHIDNLPINGRDYISFSLITPGVTRDLTLQQGVTAASALSFNGQSARSNNIMVDGLDNNDHTVGGVRGTFSQEAIQEFQVLTNSYSAEFGKASSGIVNIVTKSGTNQLSGNAFLYLRDDSLNSKEYFDKYDASGNPIDRTKADFSRKQFGGTLGGNLEKDKAFFFLSYERTDVNANNFVTIEPGAAALLEGNGFPVELGSVPYEFEDDRLLAKIDYYWNSSHNLTFRANYSNVTNENIESFGGIDARSMGAVLLREDWSLSALLTNVLPKNWLSETRFLVARQDQAVNSLDPNCTGPCDMDDEGGPTVQISGVANVGRLRTTPQTRDNLRLQFIETISYFGSDHLFKAGIDYNYYDGKASLPLHFGGRFIFAPLPAIPGLGIAKPLSATQAFSLGLPAAYVQGYGKPLTEQITGDISLFVQDQWRVSERFMFKLGARYQKQLWHNVTYGANGYGQPYPFPRDDNNLAPRLSVAYDPTGRGTTSLHASYGIFYGNNVNSLAAVTDLLDGRDGVRTLALRFPASIAAWKAPGRKLPEPTTYPSMQFTIDPGLETPFAHHVSAGSSHALGADLSLSANFVYVRGKNQVGTIDYNPIVPSLGSGRRPLDINGEPGTSASVLQYTAFGETWYKGLLVGLRKRFAGNYQLTCSYTLSKAEDTSTDFLTEFIPQENGRGRRSPTDTGLPVDFEAHSERGPSVNDQRHRFVLAGYGSLPWDFRISTIISAASGRPYNILAGADLNGDGDGGTFPTDRARRDPGDPSTSVTRNSGRLPATARVDLRLNKIVHTSSRTYMELIFEVFNLFNRTNFTGVNNVFGIGTYPVDPLPSYGRFTEAAFQRQIQLAAKFNF